MARFRYCFRFRLRFGRKICLEFKLLGVALFFRLSEDEVVKNFSAVSCGGKFERKTAPRKLVRIRNRKFTGLTLMMRAASVCDAAAVAVAVVATAA